MVKLISAILSLSMLFGAGAAPNSTTNTANVPVTVEKQQAVYGKHENKSTQKQYWLKEPVSSINVGMNQYGNVSCSLRNDGVFECYGEYVKVGKNNPTVYTTNGSTLWEYQYGTYSDGKTYVQEYVWKSTLYTNVTDEMGKYISDIIVDNGSLPADGRHSDGYWYVFKNLVED